MASMTRLGHGSFTFVCRSRWARRKRPGASRCGVLADEVHVPAQAELLDQRLGGPHEPTGDEQPRIGTVGEQRRQRSQAELEPVCLRLVTAEDEHRAACGRPPRRRESLDVHRIREHLPAPARLAEKEVGGALAEVALVENVVGGQKRAPQRPVYLLDTIPRPARVANPILVDHDRRAAAPREPEERAQVARQPCRAEVEQREVGGAVREALGEALELRGAAGNPFPRGRHAVVPVEDA